MRVVGLVAFRNEEPYVPYLLASLLPLVDHVVALDDRSTDGGPDLFRDAGVAVITGPSGLTFGGRRQLLLQEGRRAAGTHFVVVDADEAFDAQFSQRGRRVIEELAPGQALAFPFRTLWKGWTRYRIGREYDLPLTCAFRDDSVSTYEDTFIHESRLPRRIAASCRRLRSDEGSMVHFQFAAWHRAQVKQAWYRCNEYLRGKVAMRVNARYLFTLDGPRVRTRPVEPETLAHLPPMNPLADLPPSWHLEEILTWFDRYGPNHFEALQIWHVGELREAFVATEEREPHPSRVAPPFVRILEDAYGSARALTRRAIRRR